MDMQFGCFLLYLRQTKQPNLYLAKPVPVTAIKVLLKPAAEPCCKHPWMFICYISSDRAGLTIVRAFPGAWLPEAED